MGPTTQQDNANLYIPLCYFLELPLAAPFTTLEEVHAP